MKKYFFLVLISILGLFLRYIFLERLASQTNFLTIVFNVGSIIGLWFLMKELFNETQFKWLPEFSAIFLSISPWHILLLNYGLKTNTVILLAILGTIFFKKLCKAKKSFYVSFVILILLLSQIYKPFAFNFSNTQAPLWLTDQQRREHGTEYNEVFVKLLHNKGINYGLSFLEHYSNYFSPDFLFIVGDTNLSLRIPDFGLMYLFDPLFLIAGFLTIFKKIELQRSKVILIWLVLAPINSALTYQPSNMLSSALMIVPLIAISSLGMVTIASSILTRFKGLAVKYFSMVILTLLIIWDFSRFIHQYLFHLIR